VRKKCGEKKRREEEDSGREVRKGEIGAGPTPWIWGSCNGHDGGEEAH
jgi:hypothetical protein